MSGPDLTDAPTTLRSAHNAPRHPRETAMPPLSRPQPPHRFAFRRADRSAARDTVIPRGCVVGLACALLFAPVAPALADGDATVGKALHDKDCVACHARKFGGDPDRIYTRADRKATTPAKLKAQIALCNSELGTGYFPEEENHLAAYLDLRYYRFK